MSDIVGSIVIIDNLKHTRGTSDFLGLPPEQPGFVLWPVVNKYETKYEVKWPPKGSIEYWSQIREDEIARVATGDELDRLLGKQDEEKAKRTRMEAVCQSNGFRNLEIPRCSPVRPLP